VRILLKGDSSNGFGSAARQYSAAPVVIAPGNQKLAQQILNKPAVAKQAVAKAKLEQQKFV
jgi:hypothetical protein